MTGRDVFPMVTGPVLPYLAEAAVLFGADIAEEGRRLILVNPVGGLGNQLFGYAFTRAVQERMGNHTAYFNRKLYRRPYIKTNTAIPEFFPDYYKLLPDKTVVLNDRVSLILSLIYRRLLWLFFSEQSTGLTREEFFTRTKWGYIYSRDEECPCDDVSQLPLKAKLNYIEGYFQWPRLFLPLRDKLRVELSLKEPLSESAQSILREIKSCESVCLHVRRGDYLNYDFYDICHYPYYKKAMDYIAGKVENPVFYIFSNDIDWVEKNYEIPYPHKFVKENHAAPFELELMRGCKHFVISNSTFSWWAQFLSENEAAVVVAPRPWFGDGRKCSLYLPYWHTIDPLAEAEAEVVV